MKHAIPLKLVLCFLVLCLTSLLHAGEIKLNNNNTEILYTSFNYQHLSIKSTISSVQFREVQSPLGTFTELFVMGYGYSNIIGDPKLPVLNRMIEIPLNPGFTITITSQVVKEFDLSAYGIHTPVIPAQPPARKTPPLPPFIQNNSTYQNNDFFGGPVIQVQNDGMLRGVTLARLTIAPVQYNPVTNTLRVYEEIEATVQFTGTDIPATISLKKEKASPFFGKVYRMLPNYQPVTDELITSGPQTYVIVAPPDFEQTLQPFIHWKTKKGFKVIEAYTNNPNVGNTTSSIRGYLMGLYNNPPAGYAPPSFVLFTGDVAQIPAWTTGGHPSDLYYCEYTNDHIPEVYYGRFPAQTTAHLQTMIDKTLEYEQYLFPDPGFLGEVVMVAGADASHQLTWGNGQINYGTTYYFNTAHNLLSHTYLQPEPAGANYSLQIRTNVSDGVAYANYTAHGSEQGWSDPAFEIQHIPPLQNDHEYCLMVGNCCKTSNFSVNCFAEELLRADLKAALGYIGCSDYSYWDEDYWWGCGFKAVSANPVYDPQHLGAYDVTFHDHGEVLEDWYVTQGQMFVGGNMAVQESNSSMKVYYWETYCLMGDPSLMVYFSIPPAISASYSDPLMIGSHSLVVNTEPYAYVALSLNDSTLLDAKCADSTGLATLIFDTLNAPCYLPLVITKQNRKPLIDSIQVIQPNGPYLVYASCSINDSVGGNNNHLADFSESITLNMTVNNIGLFTASAVTGTLTTNDTNLVVTDALCTFDSIPAGGSATCPDAFAMDINDFVEDQHVVNCTLNMASGPQSWTSMFNFILNAPVLTIGAVTVLDPTPGGNNNGILDPGETAKLKIINTNTGHAAVGNASGHMTVQPGSNAYVMVTNPNCYIGYLPISGSQFVYFDVIVNGITPPGTVVNLEYLLTAGSLNQFAAIKDIALTIGQIPQFNITNGYTTTCNANFYDSGGPNSNYNNNEFLTMTFYPGITGAKVEAIFSQFDVEPEPNCSYDYLKIFNGSNYLSPLIGTFCGTTIPDTIKATSVSGALTFQFHSDYNTTYPGWTSHILCYGGPLTLLANAFPPNVCQGGSSQLVAIPSGGSGNYSYLWNPPTYLDDPTIATPVSTPEETIIYTVTVWDENDTIVSDPIQVTVLDSPEPPVITENGALLESNAPYGNQWYLNGNMIPGANGQTYTPAASGAYHATFTDSVSGCASDPSNTIYFLITRIEELQQDRMVRIFPNPFRDQFIIEFLLPEASHVYIGLFDAYGRKVIPVLDANLLSAGLQRIAVDTPKIPDGFYYCRITTGSYVIVKKIMSSK
jgi:hypothetical protein